MFTLKEIVQTLVRELKAGDTIQGRDGYVLDAYSLGALLHIILTESENVKAELAVVNTAGIQLKEQYLSCSKALGDAHIALQKRCQHISVSPVVKYSTDTPPTWTCDICGVTISEKPS